MDESQLQRDHAVLVQANLGTLYRAECLNCHGDTKLANVEAVNVREVSCADCGTILTFEPEVATE